MTKSDGFVNRVISMLSAAMLGFGGRCGFALPIGRERTPVGAADGLAMLDGGALIDVIGLGSFGLFGGKSG
jgi:hypothetical protein